MVNNFYPTAYNNAFGYNNQYPQNQIRMVNQNRVEIPRVHGKAGAEMYPIPENSSVLLLDDQEDIVWLKITDAAGYTATLNAYDFKLHQDKTQMETKSLDDRITRLEGIIDELYITTNNRTTNDASIKTVETKSTNDSKRKQSTSTSNANGTA